MELDTRWKQRLDNYCRALDRLTEAINLYCNSHNFEPQVVEIIKEVLIQRFEYTHELAWNLMKDYETYQGESDIHDSRDAIRKALSIGLITDGVWMETIADRNNTSHNYDEKSVEDIVLTIVGKYHDLFCQFAERMKQIATEGR